MGLFFDKGVSSENNPMEETLCGWHVAVGKIRAGTPAEPRSDRARTAGEGTLCSTGIMASCARTNGGLDSGLRVRPGNA
jgi:hypothetical protein